MKVRKRTPVQDAWQHDGSPPHSWPAWVKACVIQRHVGEDTHLILHRRSGDQIVNRGDWLIQNLDGEPEWLTGAIMRAEYEEVRS